MKYQKGYEPTEAQKWQRKRRAAKGMVSSMVGLTDYMLKHAVISNSTRRLLTGVSIYLETILNNWEAESAESKQQYLERRSDEESLRN